MDNGDIQLIGSPCGQHGPYTFYKAFKYTKNGIKRVVTLSEFFFVKLWIDSDLLCIGELQLLWCDKNSEQVLASLRLYFLPENTPEGRLDHGEDEVLAISEKVVLRVEDLITWITVDAEWTWGRLANCEKDVKEAPEIDDNKCTISTLTDSSLDFTDVEKERKALDHNAENEGGPLVIILSYPRYCRYRAMMRRLEGVEDEYLKYKIVRALGGFTACTKNTRVLFCKDTFDYPELEGHELLCNHLAPKLKGRPRGKRKKRSVSPGSESNESESSISNVVVFPTILPEKITTEGRNGLRCDTSLRRSTRAVENSESKEFLKELSVFMKKHYTPIGKIPSLGYKEIDLYSFYTKVQKLGGYDSVTANRLWKSIFDDMSGHQNSTSAATVIRRHYERFLLPYERHVKGEEYKPLPVSERRRLKSKNGGSSASDAETSEGTSRSGNSTPVPQTPVTPVENKEFNIQVKTESKTSSLRSIRVKSERQKDKQIEKTNNNNNNNNNNNSEPNNCESNEIVKTENETETDNVMKTESIIIVKPEKDVEPLTSAIAPIVQKLPLEKSPSPVDGKENIPIIETGDIPTNTRSESPDIIEVPYKPKSPTEIIDLEKTTNLDEQTTFLNDMKKDKLDILKEGGLEVTPIRAFVSPSSQPKDLRPTVIQPTGVIHEMPPPPPPPPPPPSTSSLLPQALNVNQLTNNHHPHNKTIPPIYKKLPYMNGVSTPPKVIQSKSIYSYSEQTVYGNPKEFNLTSINLSKHSEPVSLPPPPPPPPSPRQLHCDILDLSATNFKKPSIEIMKVPNLINHNHSYYHHHQQQPQQQQHPHHHHHHQQQKQIYNNSTYAKPQTYNHLLDGRRLGSNVEITLVNNNNNNSNSNKSSSMQNQSNKYNSIPSIPTNHRYSQKRPSSEGYPHQKIPRLEDINKLNKSSLLTGFPHASREMKYSDIPPHLYTNSNSGGSCTTSGGGGGSSSLKPDYSALMKVPLPQPPPPPPPQHTLPPTHSSTKPSSIPPYLLQLYDGNKSLPSPYLPFLDPFYYLYPHNALNTTPQPQPPHPPILPFPSQEQLKFYSDLMARNSRINFPFPINPTNDHLNNLKKS